MQSITILTQYFYPSLSATAQLMTDLAKGLAMRGYNLNIVTGTQSSGTIPESLNQVNINRAFSPVKSSTSISSKINSSIFYILGALAYVIFKQPRNVPLLIASNPPYAGIMGICFKLLKGGKYCFILQDIFPESAIMTGVLQSQGILFKFFSWLIHLTCKYAQTVIVLSSSMQAFLEQKYPDIKDKIQVLENWAVENISPVDKQNNWFAKQYNLDEKFTVLYSGNLGRLHDIETIALAAKLLKDAPIQFVFIGKGAKIKVLKEAIATHDLKNILLLPFQNRETLPLSLTACDASLVSLIPGAESIVAPSKLYGMLAAGRAVIAVTSPNSYIDQLLTTHDCGVNIPPNNPQQLASVIQELAQQSQRTKAMGKNARQLYEQQYTFQRALNEYIKLFQGFTSNPNMS